MIFAIRRRSIMYIFIMISVSNALFGAKKLSPVQIRQVNQFQQLMRAKVVDQKKAQAIINQFKKARLLGQVKDMQAQLQKKLKDQQKQQKAQKKVIAKKPAIKKPAPKAKMPKLTPKQIAAQKKKALADKKAVVAAKRKADALAKAKAEKARKEKGKKATAPKDIKPVKPKKGIRFAEGIGEGRGKPKKAPEYLHLAEMLNKYGFDSSYAKELYGKNHQELLVLIQQLEKEKKSKKDIKEAISKYFYDRRAELQEDFLKEARQNLLPYIDEKTLGTYDIYQIESLYQYLRSLKDEGKSEEVIREELRKWAQQGAIGETPWFLHEAREELSLYIDEEIVKTFDDAKVKILWDYLNNLTRYRLTDDVLTEELKKVIHLNGDELRNYIIKAQGQPRPKKKRQIPVQK